MFLIISVLLTISLAMAVHTLEEKYLYISIALLLLLVLYTSYQEKKHAIQSLLFKHKIKKPATTKQQQSIKSKSIANGKKKK